MSFSTYKILDIATAMDDGQLSKEDGRREILTELGELSNELADGEYESVHINGHSVYISNEDGVPVITVRDHADFAIEGPHKGDVNIVYTSGEFGSSFERIGNRAFWERYLQ